MDTETDWHRELDCSFGTGEDAPVERYLAAGQRAVWRRRVTWFAAGTAVAVVVGLGSAFGSGGTPPARAPVATDPSTTSSPSVAVAPPAAEDEAFGGLVKWTGSTPEPLPGVVVVEQVRDPVPSSSGSSIGLVLRSDTENTWMLITLDGTSASASYTLEGDSGWATFDQWLDDQVALHTGNQGLRLVTLMDDGSVTPALPDVEVLDQQADPKLDAYGTERPGPSAVALVRWRGARWFVLAVRMRGQDSLTTVAEGKTDGASTLGQFVAFMADKADEGGMR